MINKRKLDEISKDDDIVVEFFDNLMELNNKKRKLWMNGLTDNEIVKYENEYIKLKNSIKDRIITEAHILKSNLPFEEKVKLIEQIKILNNTDPYTREYLELKNHLYDKIVEDDNMTDSDLDTENQICNKYKELNVRLRILRSKHSNETKAILF